MKVLLVEDELETSTALKKLLEHRVPDVEVKIASTLAIGAADYLAFSPSVVVLDAELPDSTAFETMAQIRPLFPNAAVVVSSAFEEESLVTSAFENGAADFLVKDGSVNQVQRIIFAYLRKLYAATTTNSPA